MANKEEKVLKDDNVEILYTNKSAFHKAGDTAIVHRLAAEKLVKKGFATLKKGFATLKK